MANQQPPIQDKRSFTEWAVPALVILLGIAILSGAGYLVYQWIWAKKPEPIHRQIANLKRVQELHLAKIHFESLIPITKERRNKFQFLLVAPMELSMYVDMEKVEYEPITDSLLRITLPQPEVSEVYIDFRKTKEYNYSSPSLMAQVMGKDRFDYEAVVQEVQQKIRKGKAQVLARAQSEEVMGEVITKAESYLRNVLNSLGYQVEFVKPEITNKEDNLIKELEALLDDNEEIDESKLYKRLVKLVIKSR